MVSVNPQRMLKTRYGRLFAGATWAVMELDTRLKPGSSLHRLEAGRYLRAAGA